MTDAIDKTGVHYSVNNIVNGIEIVIMNNIMNNIVNDIVNDGGITLLTTLGTTV